MQVPIVGLSQNEFVNGRLRSEGRSHGCPVSHTSPLAIRVSACNTPLPNFDGFARFVHFWHCFLADLGRVVRLRELFSRHDSNSSCPPRGVTPVTAATRTHVPTRTTPAVVAVPKTRPPSPIPPTLAGEIGRHVPTSFVTTSPSGHWTVACEAAEDTDHSGNLLVQVSQHGELTGDVLKPVLYVGDKPQPIDEYAGSDPSGRFVAFVKDRRLQLLNTVTGANVTLERADTRATQASFQPLRSLAFSDDGKWLAYAQGDREVTLLNLETEQETTYSVDDPKLYRLRFAAGSRYLLLEVITTDSNKNGKLSWLTPERTDRAPCPSPIPTYNVWQFPGDTPETRLLDVKTGNLIAPQGFAFAAGNVYIERTPDLSLLINEPGKPVRNVSTAECAGRVMHVDLGSGNVVFGCASAWGPTPTDFLAHDRCADCAQLRSRCLRTRHSTGHDRTDDSVLSGQPNLAVQYAHTRALAAFGWDTSALA